MVKLEERTVGGLHDFLLSTVLRRYAAPGGRAIDLGAGAGALTQRLQDLGLEVLGIDVNPAGFRAGAPFLVADLDRQGFAVGLDERGFDLVVAVEVIEHLENPVEFLRGVRRLLKADGVAVITTPNVENLPARVKFLLTGRLRMMDERGDPTHVSPIFFDLLTRQYLPRAGLCLLEHHVFPPKGYRATRLRYRWAFRALAGLLSGHALLGDTHVFVLRARP